MLFIWHFPRKGQEPRLLVAGRVVTLAVIYVTNLLVLVAIKYFGTLPRLCVRVHARPCSSRHLLLPHQCQCIYLRSRGEYAAALRLIYLSYRNERTHFCSKTCKNLTRSILFHCFGFPDAKIISDAKQQSINGPKRAPALGMPITRPQAAQGSWCVLGAGGKKAASWGCAKASVSRTTLINLVITACEWCCAASRAEASSGAVGSHLCPPLCWTDLAADSAVQLVPGSELGRAIALTVLSVSYPEAELGPSLDLGLGEIVMKEPAATFRLISVLPSERVHGL